MLNLWVLM